jgi:hypothetical protein
MIESDGFQWAGLYWKFLNSPPTIVPTVESIPAPIVTVTR